MEPIKRMCRADVCSGEGMWPVCEKVTEIAEGRVETLDSKDNKG